MANRTLQFYGYAYGTVPVQLNAHINGTTVFSGTVPTVDQPLPVGDSPDMTEAPVLFTVADSSLVPTEFSGSLPMTISVATGDGIALSEIYCNYMESAISSNVCIAENSSIANNTLTVGTITSGAFAVGQNLWGENVLGGTQILGANRAPDFYYVNPAQTVPTGTINATLVTPVAGNSTAFQSCYNGTPVNSDGTPDPRSSVTIDDIAQNPVREGADGTWTWVVAQGSTIACNLNVSVGNVV